MLCNVQPDRRIASPSFITYATMVWMVSNSIIFRLQNHCQKLLTLPVFFWSIINIIQNDMHYGDQRRVVSFRYRTNFLNIRMKALMPNIQMCVRVFPAEEEDFGDTDERQVEWMTRKKMAKWSSFIVLGNNRTWDEANELNTAVLHIMRMTYGKYVSDQKDDWPLHVSPGS